MDENLRTAARTGNVSDLYRLIQGDGNVLRLFDEVEFIDTPLHIAAEEGCIGFAMEIMSLKPTFARKLNQQGLSPIHLAVKKGHKELALRLLEIDKDLVRIKGKKGKTPLHYISKVGNHNGLLDRFLKACPECIRDVTTQNHTALHIATKHNRLDVPQVLIRTLRKKEYYREVVNQKDEDGNTLLHIAASNNQPQMLKLLLLDCKADKHATNQAGSTALDVAHQHNNRESISILRGSFIPIVSNFKYKLKKQIVKYVTKASPLNFHDIDNISSEHRNALLVILGLLLTATFQASLSPPGSVWQDDISFNYNFTEGFPKRFPGKSVMDETSFLHLYIPTYVVFVVSFFLTLVLIKPFPRGFRNALEVLLAFLAICFDQSISFIAPNYLVTIVIKTFSVLVFILMVFMCIAYRASKLSVAILGCWLFPSVLFDYFGGHMVLGNAIQGCWIFLFLYDEFWKGTILVLGYCLFIRMDVFIDAGAPRVSYAIAFIGCWLVLSLCRFCIKRCSERSKL